MKRVPNCNPAENKKQGFSMIELLVVMGVIAIILAMAVPAMQSMMAGNKLVQAGDELASSLATMQQEAIKGNEAVEVRFYTFRDLNLPVATPQFRAYQFVKKVTASTESSRKSTGASKDGFVVVPLSKIERLPEGIIMLNESEYSTLITSQKMIRESRNVRIPDSEDGEYYAFHFRPDGSTTLPKTGSDQWFVTLVNEADILANAGGLPANFVTLQVDAHNGSARKFQPGVQ
ncbi:MAG: Verru_Chthon cassette protein D [Verrucomicrobia bacterium]|nr:Verru_Chthon cassette protein D [Verrucomicrobiota bacterium]